MSNQLLEKATSGPQGAAGAPVVIRITGLDVAYGAVQAVRNVNLEIRQGEIFGLLGPNGAGKTTTLAAIEGLVQPRAGRVEVLGYDVRTHAQEVKRRLGVSLQTTAFFDSLKLWELVRFYAGLYETPLSKAQALALLTRFDLQEKAEVQAQQLSGGQQQRLALVLAIANDPQIVILDEPTTGLDPQARRNVWDSVHAIRAEGRTILLTTHYMEEAQELCHRVAIIDRGEIIALDTPGGLINGLHADSLITLTVRLPEDRVRALPGVTGAHYEGDKLSVQSRDTQATVLALQGLATEYQQLLTDLSIKQPDLEDVFITLTGRKIR